MATSYMVSLTSNGNKLYVCGENGTGLADRDRADVYPTRFDADWAAQWAAEDTRKLKRWYGRGDGKPIIEVEELPFAVEQITRLCHVA
jgi:hypothetical protein